MEELLPIEEYEVASAETKIIDVLMPDFESPEIKDIWSRETLPVISVSENLEALSTEVREIALKWVTEKPFGFFKWAGKDGKKVDVFVHKNNLPKEDRGKVNKPTSYFVIPQDVAFDPSAKGGRGGYRVEELHNQKSLKELKQHLDERHRRREEHKNSFNIKNNKRTESMLFLKDHWSEIALGILNEDQLLEHVSGKEEAIFEIDGEQVVLQKPKKVNVELLKKDPQKGPLLNIKSSVDVNIGDCTRGNYTGASVEVAVEWQREGWEDVIARNPVSVKEVGITKVLPVKFIVEFGYANTSNIEFEEDYPTTNEGALSTPDWNKSYVSREWVADTPKGKAKVEKMLYHPDNYYPPYKGQEEDLFNSLREAADKNFCERGECDYETYNKIKSGALLEEIGGIKNPREVLEKFWNFRETNRWARLQNVRNKFLRLDFCLNILEEESSYISVNYKYGHGFQPHLQDGSFTELSIELGLWDKWGKSRGRRSLGISERTAEFLKEVVIPPQKMDGLKGIRQSFNTSDIDLSPEKRREISIFLLDNVSYGIDGTEAPSSKKGPFRQQLEKFEIEFLTIAYKKVRDFVENTKVE